MSDEDPFHDIWSNFNELLQSGEFYDLKELYVSWEETRVDFDNFHDMYQGIKYRLQKIIENCGNFVEE